MTNDETGQDGGASPAPSPPNSFAKFTQEHWVKWIRKFLNGELCEPAITVGQQEPYSALASLYESLETETQRDLFADAVGDLFAHTALSARKARIFRSLIELIGMLTPYNVRDVVRSRFYLRSFAGMEDDGLDLHTLLLAANCKYPMDQELAEYMGQEARKSGDFGYIIVCMRAVSEPGGNHYLRFLETALPHVNTWERAATLALEVGDIIELHGCRNFCRWYSAAARRIRRGDELFDTFQRFEGALKNKVFPKAPLLSPYSHDPHLTLVAAQLHAYDKRFNAKEVLALARLHQQAGRATTVNALVNIWRRMQVVFLKEGLPWYYYAPPARRMSNGGPAMPAYISSGPDPASSVSDTFYESQEPALAVIFETVKDICYDVPEAEAPLTAAANA